MKTFLITGASRGIGLEAAKFLALEHQVVVVSRNAANIEPENSNVVRISEDISTDSGVKAIGARFQELGIEKLDGLIHNAGQLINKPFETLTRDDFELVYGVNVFAVAMLTQTLLPFLKRGSHVVGISSMGGVQGSSKFKGLAAYSSSKGALISLFELLAEEYKDAGIYFNSLALGAVQTEMLSEAFPGYVAPVTAAEMGVFVGDFAENGHRFFNGKLLPVALSTP